MINYPISFFAESDAPQGTKTSWGVNASDYEAVCSVHKDAITELLLIRGTAKTICPSEVARQLYPADWREHMEDIRAVAVEMAEDGIIEITQKGTSVTPPFVGPIRLRLKK